jgi:hypothetical protein
MNNKRKMKKIKIKIKKKKIKKKKMHCLYGSSGRALAKL